MKKEKRSLNRVTCFNEQKNKKTIDSWLLPDDFIEVFTTFFKEFGWKIDDCLNLSLGQITFICENLIKKNVPSKVKTKDKNITIIEDDKKITLEENRRIKKLVEEKEKELKRKLTAVEMNKILGKKSTTKPLEI